jgi:hypothetical protein
MEIGAMELNFILEGLEISSVHPRGSLNYSTVIQKYFHRYRKKMDVNKVNMC